MGKVLVQDFLQALDQLEDKEYLLYKIRYDIAPTLAGIKPSSLMTFANYKRKMFTLWEQHKEEVCASLGIHYYELKKKSDRVIVLFYQDEALTNCLSHWKNKKFLQEQGYEETKTLEDSLGLLKRRYEANCPHELGIFLGYPLHDVTAFMENKGASCLACKYWKVYKDLEKALRTFDAYDQEREKVIKTVLQLQERRKSA